MFCHKCGQESPEGSAFCQKCGAKLITNETVSQAPVMPISEPQAPIPSALNSISQKKKPKMLLIIGGAIVAIILAIVLIFALGYNEYIESIKSGEVILGSRVSYEALFNRYLVSPEWKENANSLDDGESHIVTVSGDVKNTSDHLYLMLIVMDNPSDPDTIILSPMALGINDDEIDNEETIKSFLDSMVAMFNDGSDDISALLLGGQQLSETDSTDFSLSATYTNEVEGVSFKYPSSWQIIEDSGDLLKVSLLADSNVTFDANWAIDPLGVLSSDKTTLQEAFNENSDIGNRNITDLSDTQIGSLSYKKLQYESQNFLDIDIVTTEYWYAIGEDIYTIRCSCPKTLSATYDPIFNEIIESYTITNADASAGSGTGALPTGDTEAELLEVTQAAMTGEMLTFGYGDYDGNGSYEAFATSYADFDQDSELYTGVTLWFTNQNGLAVVEEELFGYPMELIITDEKTLFVWEVSAGGSGSTSIIYGVDDGVPYELSLSETYMNVAQRDGMITGFENDFSKGYHDYLERNFVYDNASGELVIGSDTLQTEQSGSTPISDQGSYIGTMLVNTGGPYLNMREGPGTDYELNGKIPDGTILEVTETMDSWGAVSYEGSYGWVSLQFLEPIQ